MSYFDNANAGVAGNCHGGKFEANKAGANDDDIPRRGQPLPQRIGVGESSQREHAVKVGPGHRERSESCASGENKVVPGDFPTRGQLETALSAIDRRYWVAANEVNPLLGVEFRRPQP
jgi:hypothetical protein